MTYDELLIEATNLGIIVKEFNLRTKKGFCHGNRIAIDKNLTSIEKSCVLCEELGHYFLSVGDITNQELISNRKQELLARKWGYNKKIGLLGLINAFENNCLNKYETAEFLNVTEEYLDECIDYYRYKYGVMHIVDNYIIYFLPTLGILKYM
ncbi:MAG: hypothetical protein RR460_07865 [Clostridium sp.]